MLISSSIKTGVKGHNLWGVYWSRMGVSPIMMLLFETLGLKEEDEGE